MPSLGTMKTRIALELDRDNLTDAVSAAINDAIAEFASDRFWFNEGRDLTFSTVVAQRIYTATDAPWIGTVIEIDGLFIMVGGNNRPLDRVSPEEIEWKADNSAARGAPYEYAYFGEQIWLYPLPDRAYTVRALAHYRLSPLTSDADSNAWTTQAERLIRRRAKQLIFAETVLDANQAVAMQPLIEQELSLLKAESSRRRADGIVQPSGF